MKKMILPLAATLLAACNGTQKTDSAYYDAGVSEQLAQHRKATIHELTYNLAFDIPAEASKPIQGYDTLRFTLDEPQEVILDFREEAERIQQVSINGTETSCRIENEHIILPAPAMQTGLNEVAISFVAGDQSLNRNDDYLYTLFVPDRARTAFPCMDQPNLKARFTLTLQVPAAWKAVSNGRCATSQTEGDRQTIRFAQTDPLSTYLFAFAAGRFEHQEYTEEGRTIGAYYRETDPKRLAQLPEIFRQVMYSLHWLEDFTGMPYPFAKYDLVILPGFQFGGMEHTGATFYNDNTLFLAEKPTMDEQLSRSQLIAHETSHMWFGDCVTMEWFNDVWTKEVFANYFAAAITAPLFPEVNHDLNWMKTYTAAALSEDRTWGGTPIRQELDNMRNAGLIYNSIIYNKAPVMMRKLVELMGEEAFRRGIQQYLQQFQYGNATWEDLIALLDAETSQDLTTFSEVWVNQKGMPQLDIQLTQGKLTVTQHDPYNRGLGWPQTFALTLHTETADTTLQVQMTATEPTSTLPIPQPWCNAQLWPNTDGRAYGLITLTDKQLEGLLNTWPQVHDKTGRFALLTTLHENYLANRLSDTRWLEFLQQVLPVEQDALTASTLIGYLREPALSLSPAEKGQLDQALWRWSGTHPLYSARVQLLRQLFSLATQPEVVDHLYSLWEIQSNPLLSINDYNNLSYELAIRKPELSQQILSVQAQRNDNPDRLRQFQFISRAAVADTLALDSLFQQLLTDPQARRIEPWTASVLSLLNHPLRQTRSVRYIRPALEALEEVQRTGDIFFPGRWCSAVLGNHRSAAAYQEVKHFLQAHPDYLPLRVNKILLGSYALYRKNGDNLFGK